MLVSGVTCQLPVMLHTDWLWATATCDRAVRAEAISNGYINQPTSCRAVHASALASSSSAASGHSGQLGTELVPSDNPNLGNIHRRLSRLRCSANSSPLTA